MATEAFVIAITTQGTREVQRDLRSIGTTGQAAAKDIENIGKAAEKSSRSFSAVTESLRVMRNLLVAFSFARAVSGIGELANQAVLLQNKIITVTHSHQEMQAVMEAVAQTSIKTRTSLESNVDTLVRLARSTGALHLSWQQLIDLEETIAATVHIAGASTQQASRALMDFAEGLAAGSLQGRQLRAMVMQLPTLGDAIAKSFGLAGAQLMGFLKANPGQLDPEHIVMALQAIRPEMMALMGSTAVTVGQAITNLHTQLLLFVGRLNDATQFSQKFANALDYVGQHVGEIIAIVAAIAGIVALRIAIVTVFELAFSFEKLFGIVNFLLLGFPRLAISLIQLPFRVAAAGVQFFTTALEVAQGVAAAFTLWMNGLASFTGVMGFFTSFAGLAVTFGVLVPLIYAAGSALVAFFKPLAQLSIFSGALKDFNFELKDIPTLFEAAFNTIVDEFPLVTAALKGMWDSMVNGMLNRIGEIGNAMGPALLFGAAGTLLGGPLGGMAGVALGALTSKLGLSPQANVFNTSRPTDLAADPLAQLAERFGVNAYNLKNGPTGHASVPGMPKVQVGKPLDETDQAKGNRLSEQLQTFLKQFAPDAGAQAKIDQWQKLVDEINLANKAHKTNIDILAEARKAGLEYNSVGEATADIQRMIRREIDGVGNVDQQVSQKIGMLTQDYFNQAMSLEEVNVQLAKQFELLSKAHPNDVALGMQAARAKHAINDDGTKAGAAVDKILTLSEKGDDTAVAIKAINDQMALTPAIADVATKEIRNLEIELLRTKTDALSGFQAGILETQQTLNDFASTAATTVKTAFQDLQDTLVEFFDTGRINMQKFVQDILQNLTKLAVQQTITGPLANLMFSPNGQGQSGGLFGSGGLLSGLFGGGGLESALGGGGTLGSSVANPMYVSIVPGLGSVVAGGGGAGGLLGGGNIFSGAGNWLDQAFGGPGLGSGGAGLLSDIWNGGGGTGALSGGISGMLSGLGGLLGFATGGDFTVGGQGGTDSQLVNFRATPGEKVSVRRPGDDGNSGGGTTSIVMHVHGVQDVDSFHRSTGQVVSTMHNAISRTRARNGG